MRLNKQGINSPEFEEIWNKVINKTVYRVQLDTEELIKKCVKDFKDLPLIPKMRLVSQTAEPEIAKPGIFHAEKDGIGKLYFVLETKGSMSLFDLRTKEQLKIHCGKEHFKAIDENIELRLQRIGNILKSICKHYVNNLICCIK